MESPEHDLSPEILEQYNGDKHSEIFLGVFGFIVLTIGVI